MQSEGVHRYKAVWFVLYAISATVASAQPTADQLRGAVPRAEGAVTIDGELREYSAAFCTPLEYFHPDKKNRPAQFFYLWDDEAFYVGLRTLDEKTFSPVHPLWEGDAVEWYFDTRRGNDFLSHEWPNGPANAVHCFFTAMDRAEIKPRFCLRPGREDAIPEKDIEVAARRWEHGLEAEFKLPWSNFSDFQPRVGEVIGLDAELSYSDGGPRSYRSFVFGSPLSVDHPENLAKVLLTDRIDASDWNYCGPVMMPMRVDVPWRQQTKLHVVGHVAVAPNHAEEVGKVVFHLTGLQGEPLGEYPADKQVVIEPGTNFALLEARWPATVAPAGTYHAQAIIYDPHGKELARVAPRLVSVNMQPGY